MAGDAFPLKSIRVILVGSTNVGWEEIKKNYTQTKYEHGGEEFYIWTEEIGIGGEGTARLEGSVLKLRQKIPIVNVQNTIIGFKKEWDACGKSAGLFQYENTSLSYPWNSISIMLNIL